MAENINNTPENNRSPNPLRKMGHFVIEFVESAREQLRTADLNPHEGRLRASAAPDEYIQVPDYPPEEK